jgi:hypothetical protein
LAAVVRIAPGARFVWRGPRNGRIDVDGIDEIGRSAAVQLAPGTRPHVEDSRTGYLESDPTLIIRFTEKTYK